MGQYGLTPPFCRSWLLGWCSPQAVSRPWAFNPRNVQISDGKSSTALKTGKSERQERRRLRRYLLWRGTKIEWSRVRGMLDLLSQHWPHWSGFSLLQKKSIHRNTVGVLKAGSLAWNVALPPIHITRKVAYATDNCLINRVTTLQSSDKIGHYCKEWPITIHFTLSEGIVWMYGSYQNCTWRVSLLEYSWWILKRISITSVSRPRSPLGGSLPRDHRPSKSESNRPCVAFFGGCICRSRYHPNKSNTECRIKLIREKWILVEVQNIFKTFVYSICNNKVFPKRKKDKYTANER